MNNPLAEKFRALKTAETRTADSDEKKSIAVLPLKIFGTTTDAGEEDYLSLGLADALITRLSNVRQFIVRPTSSILRFQSSAATGPFQAGRELNVNFIVEGTIRFVGERLRVSIQLFSLAENSTVWAAKFDEKFTDILEIEDLISEKVVKSLLPELTGEQQKQLRKRGTNSPAAYEAYLRGRYLANQFTNDAIVKSLAA